MNNFITYDFHQNLKMVRQILDCFDFLSLYGATVKKYSVFSSQKYFFSENNEKVDSSPNFD